MDRKQIKRKWHYYNTPAKLTYNAFVIGTDKNNCKLKKDYKNKTLVYILDNIKKMCLIEWSLHHDYVHNVSESAGLIVFDENNTYWKSKLK